MLSEEEKKAIEFLQKEYKKLIEEGNILFPLYKNQAKTVLNLITKLQKENEYSICEKCEENNNKEKVLNIFYNMDEYEQKALEEFIHKIGKEYKKKEIEKQIENLQNELEKNKR